MSADRQPTRRQTLGALLGAAGLAACKQPIASKETESKRMSDTASKRLPVVFLPHGGGPWPWMERFRESYRQMTAYLEGLSQLGGDSPKAVLMISAHWEESKPTLMTSPRPPMLYDYSGFPPETYEVKWPAPGAPDLAGEVESLLSGAGIPVGRNGERGFDHGTFVPMALAYPDADMPTLQLSLVAGLDPAQHLRIGHALAPLREQGVFIIGSGMSYHNLRALQTQLRGGPAPEEDSRVFDEWLAESMAAPADEREKRLVEWEKAPAARACHPREEHLLPLHVCAGAADGDPGQLPYRDRIMGAHVSSVHFG